MKKGTKYVTTVKLIPGANEGMTHHGGNDPPRQKLHG